MSYCQGCADSERKAAGLQRENAALREQITRLREGAAAAYQFCGVRGANDKLLSNLVALAQGEPLPHAKWPTESGLWGWAKCGHLAGTTCKQCLAEAEADRERIEFLESQLSVFIGGSWKEHKRITAIVDLADNAEQDGFTGNTVREAIDTAKAEASRSPHE